MRCLKWLLHEVIKLHTATHFVKIPEGSERHFIYLFFQNVILNILVSQFLYNVKDLLWPCGVVWVMDVFFLAQASAEKNNFQGKRKPADCSLFSTDLMIHLKWN